MVVAAIILAVIVFSMRPPSSYGEAMMVAAYNPNKMFLGPVGFYGGVLIAAALGVWGLIKITKNSGSEG